MSTVTHATMKGGRVFQEDRFFEKAFGESPKPNRILAVMDGHGGAKVAEICRQGLEYFFEAPVDSATIEDRLRDAIKQLNDKTRHFYEGSTISIACIFEAESYAVVAIVGDSPVIIVDEAGAVHLGPEHNAASNKAEREAAKSRGGRYENGYMYPPVPGADGIQMTRALGDADMGNMISREPEIYHVWSPKYVIVASDGLFDPSHKETQAKAEAVAALCTEGTTASDLVNRKGHVQHDNVTAILWSAA